MTIDSLLKTTEIGNLTQTDINYVLNKFYPVGTVYVSINKDTNPNKWGDQTTVWEIINKGFALEAEGDPKFFADQSSSPSFITVNFWKRTK